MKFKYSFSLEVRQLLGVQKELCRTLYSPTVRVASFAAILLAAFVAIFPAAIVLGLLFTYFVGRDYDDIGIFLGIFLGVILYGKYLLPLVNRYFLKKRKFKFDEVLVTNYIIDETKVVVTDDGRVTEIKWHAISGISEIKNYVGLLCRGLFYYIPRTTIGSKETQIQFIAQCEIWIKDSKAPSL